MAPCVRAASPGVQRASAVLLVRGAPWLVFGQPFWCRVAPAVTSLVLSRYCERSARVECPAAVVQGNGQPGQRGAALGPRPGAAALGASSMLSRTPFPTPSASMTTPGHGNSFGLHMVIGDASLLRASRTRRGSYWHCGHPLSRELIACSRGAAKRDVAGSLHSFCSTPLRSARRQRARARADSAVVGARTASQSHANAAT